MTKATTITMMTTTATITITAMTIAAQQGNGTTITTTTSHPVWPRGISCLPASKSSSLFAERFRQACEQKSTRVRQK
jgi:hypothetical protein